MADTRTTSEIASLQPERLKSLDAYRGFTMLAMASGGFGLATAARQFPEDQTWQTVKYQFSHVEWVGCSLWDLIQPSFMFMVGVSMAYSYAGRAGKGQSYFRMLVHAARRALVLVALGVFLRSNGRPATQWTFEDVLSQIGMGYIFLFLLWGRSAKIQLAAAILLLVGYWGLFAAWPTPSADFDYASIGITTEWQQEHALTGFAAHWNKNFNPANAFDVWFLNLFSRTEAYQFNGGGYQTLSFIPSLATMIFGLMAGGLLRGEMRGTRKFLVLVYCGIFCLAAGWALGQTGICPIVKRIWTPSWAIYSTGWTLLILAACYMIIDMWKVRFWAFPGVVVGMNSIAMYFLYQTIRPWIRQTTKTHFGAEIFQIFCNDPTAVESHCEAWAAITTNVFTLAILWLICFWMYRRKVFVRI